MFFCFSCIQHILLANDMDEVPAPGLSLNCDLIFSPHKVSCDGGELEKVVW